MHRIRNYKSRFCKSFKTQAMNEKFYSFSLKWKYSANTFLLRFSIEITLLSLGMFYIFVCSIFKNDSDLDFVASSDRMVMNW
jgi:hypothetical protein